MWHKNSKFPYRHDPSKSTPEYTSSCRCCCLQLRPHEVHFIKYKQKMNYVCWDCFCIIKNSQK